MLSITEPGLPRTSPKGFALFNYGFRPFFLLGSAFGIGALAYFICLLSGETGYLPSYFDPIAWHRHEMLFGYTMAIVAGFLLTAVPNWTGHPTPKGALLGAVVLLWVAGRGLVFFSAKLPPFIVIGVDTLFPPACAIAIAPALFKARNRHNYLFITLLSVLAVANLGIHFDAIGLWKGTADKAIYLALGIIILMMTAVGGRVIPFFTERPLGISITRNKILGNAVMISVSVTVIAELLLGQGQVMAWLSLLAAGCLALNMRHWQTHRTVHAPLLWILHLGYFWLAIGFALKAGSYFSPAIPRSVATHAFTAGAIGSLTLGMMSRVSLGHTGRQLMVGRTMIVAFICITFAAILRVFAILLFPGYTELWLKIAMACWIVAFGLFFIIYMPILILPRVDGREG